MNQYVDDKFNKDPRIRWIVRKEPATGKDLMNEIVIRADGVFCGSYLSFALDLHTDGQVIDLQERLYVLPTELDGLFQHTLFDTQSESRVKDGSRIFQLIRARERICDFTRDQSAASLTLWGLALVCEEDGDDLTFRLPIQQVSYGDISSRYRNMVSRRLSRRVGLLEIYWKTPGNTGRARFLEEGSNGNVHNLARSKVTYLHRTVRDFLIYPAVWDKVVSKTAFEKFDPHLCLLKSYIRQLKLPPKVPEKH